MPREAVHPGQPEYFAARRMTATVFTDSSMSA